MLLAGITTVGEFHYVHHGNERFDLDEAVIEAAKETGIRLVLIETLYCRFVCFYSKKRNTEKHV